MTKESQFPEQKIKEISDKFREKINETKENRIDVFKIHSGN